MGGGEGIAQVLETEGGGHHLPGDWVLPARSMSGTWTSHCVFHETELIKVRQDISVEGAATLMINPATALRMLEDFVQLQVNYFLFVNVFSKELAKGSIFGMNFKSYFIWISNP